MKWNFNHKRRKANQGNYFVGNLIELLNISILSIVSQITRIISSSERNSVCNFPFSRSLKNLWTRESYAVNVCGIKSCVSHLWKGDSVNFITKNRDHTIFVCKFLAIYDAQSNIFVTISISTIGSAPRANDFFYQSLLRKVARKCGSQHFTCIGNMYMYMMTTPLQEIFGGFFVRFNTVFNRKNEAKKHEIVRLYFRPTRYCGYTEIKFSQFCSIDGQYFKEIFKMSKFK